MQHNQCMFWTYRVHRKLKGPGPCATCRAATSLHKLHTKRAPPGIKSNHAACTPPIKETENTLCAFAGGVAPEPRASTITYSHLAAPCLLSCHWKQDVHGDFSGGLIVFSGNADSPRSGPIQVATVSQRREMPPPRPPCDSVQGLQGTGYPAVPGSPQWAVSLTVLLVVKHRPPRAGCRYGRHRHPLLPLAPLKQGARLRASIASVPGPGLAGCGRRQGGGRIGARWARATGRRRAWGRRGAAAPALGAAPHRQAWMCAAATARNMARRPARQERQR